LDILLEANLFPANALENAKREYRELISDDCVISKMKSYNREVVRLDDFWMSLLGKDKTPNLINVVKCLLILSHGNASMERGFSVNKEILVENLTEDSLRAQRLVHDAVVDAGGVLKMDVPKKMLLSMRNANARWKEALQQKKSVD